jgi:TusA-related sulfurtransferase
MVRYKRKGAFAERKFFELNDGTYLVICVTNKKSQRRFKKFLKKYYQQ